MSQHAMISGNSLFIQTDMTVVTPDRNMSSLQSDMVDIQYQVKNNLSIMTG